ncbi:MAG: hypothetical protein IH840_03920 [Candidatus Heimdallarchaeota archaeon]|nr:hypothetical protein [Candidatus Heimdallarchaeota archaeon]
MEKQLEKINKQPIDRSSENMTSIEVKYKDIQRLDTIIETLLHNDMNLNQEQLFSKLLDLGENYLKELNLKRDSVDQAGTNLKTEAADQKDSKLKIKSVCKNCGTNVTPPMHCKQPMHLEELSGSLEWVCWMGTGCGHKPFHGCCDAPYFATDDIVDVERT